MYLLVVRTPCTIGRGPRISASLIINHHLPSSADGLNFASKARNFFSASAQARFSKRWSDGRSPRSICSRKYSDIPRTPENYTVHSGPPPGTPPPTTDLKAEYRKFMEDKESMYQFKNPRTGKKAIMNKEEIYAMELLEHSQREGAEVWIWGIIALNILIYLLWILPTSEENAAVEKWILENNPDLKDPKKKEEFERQLADPATREEALQTLKTPNKALTDGYQMMLNHFALTANSALYRPWTLITWGFSHADPFHLLSNMALFLMTAKNTFYVLGARNFAMLYLGSLVGSGLCSIVQKIGFDDLNSPTLGASGAVSGVVFAHSVTFPTQITYIRGIPMPGWAAGALIANWDLNGFLEAHRDGKHTDKIDHAAHLGGAIVAIAFALLVARRNSALRQQKALASAQAIVAAGKPIAPKRKSLLP